MKKKKIKYLKKISKDLKNNGYSIIYNLFSKAEVKILLKSYEENLNYCLSLINEKDVNCDIDNKYLLLQRKNKILKSRSYDLSKFDPNLYAYASKKKLLGIMRSIFNETFFLEFPQIRADDSKNSFMLPLHQEIYGQMSSKLLTLWSPLTKVSKKNGTLALIEKSHKFGLLKHQFYNLKSSKYHGVKKTLLLGHKIKYLNLESGDAVIFDPYLVHGTGKNYTQKIRWTFVARYNAISGINYLKKKNSSIRIEQK